MTIELPALQTFITDVDEAAFSDLLKSHFPRIKFIDSYIWNSPIPPVHDSMSACHGRAFSDVVIINEAICTVDRYAREFVVVHPSGSDYMGSMEGPGAIQFLRSKKANYAPGCLQDGRIL